jgi:tRNA(Ile)-lysidine synthase
MIHWIHCEDHLLPRQINVACSCGTDSIVVAHFLKTKRKKNIHLIHCNHKLRKQNDEMEASIRRFAQQFDMQLSVEYPLKPLNRNNLEVNAREFRMEAYRKFNGKVVLAHHLDDCVEGYFLNFLKGCPEYMPIPITTKLSNSNATIVRPFMTNEKEKFESYATRHGLRQFIVEDETNIDTSIRRNWVRNKILPAIYEEYPGLQKVVKKKILDAYKKSRKNSLDILRKNHAIAENKAWLVTKKEKPEDILLPMDGYPNQ